MVKYNEEYQKERKKMTQPIGMIYQAQTVKDDCRHLGIAYTSKKGVIHVKPEDAEKYEEFKSSQVLRRKPKKLSEIENYATFTFRLLRGQLVLTVLNKDMFYNFPIKQEDYDRHCTNICNSRVCQEEVMK